MARGRPSKKGLIASAASSLFRVSGYQGTSIDQVVATAGVSKPTVYSNFPSKLLLWQEVLSLLIVASDTELEVLTESLKQSEVDFIAGWIRIWCAWSDSSDRLAAYRIHWGESHKLTRDEHQLFGDFERVLIKHLSNWMVLHQVSDIVFPQLMALSREACLISKLAQPCYPRPSLAMQIEQCMTA